MGALAGYVLNVDAWDAWVKIADENGKGGKIKKFKKGDKLDDVVIDDERVEHLLENGLPYRPLFVKATEEVFPDEAATGDKSAFIAAGEMVGDEVDAETETDTAADVKKEEKPNTSPKSTASSTPAK